MIIGSVKTKKSCVSWKMFLLEFIFQNWSKALCLGWLLRVQHMLSVTDKVNRHLSKKMEKNKKNEKKKSKSVKSLRYMHEFFFPTNYFSLLESCQLYIIAKYKASSCCKKEAVIQRCSVKNVFLKILQNSQENPCARVSFLIKSQLKKRLWHMCFSVNLAKFSITFLL